MVLMKGKAWGSSVMLVMTALIWGIAFVAQSEGMNYLGGFTFNAARFLIGGAVLIPCIFLLDKINGDKQRKLSGEEKKRRARDSVAGGMCCGAALCMASSLQQFGIAQTLSLIHI